MPLPLTLDERISKVLIELDADERNLPEPLKALVLFAKLQTPDLYARVRAVIRGH